MENGLGALFAYLVEAGDARTDRRPGGTGPDRRWRAMGCLAACLAIAGLLAVWLLPSSSDRGLRKIAGTCADAKDATVDAVINNIVVYKHREFSRGTYSACDADGRQLVAQADGFKYWVPEGSIDVVFEENSYYREYHVIDSVHPRFRGSFCFMRTGSLEYSEGWFRAEQQDDAGRARTGLWNPRIGWLTDTSIEDARPFSEGLAAVRRGGLWGYIDLKGNEKIAPRFDEAGPFTNGLAKVRAGNTALQIDRTGSPQGG